MGSKLDNEIIGGFTLNYKYYTGSDFYSDGDVEDTILEICKNGNIEEELNKGNSWPILYHLSKTRENLLDWYEFYQKGSLLEIGSGCGALTGLFSKRLDRVVCIELSRRRSLINAHKNSKEGNAEIYVGNFQDVKLEEKFDYVTLIGVFEYSKVYLNCENPFNEMLNKVKGNLKKGGKLIIAIENKMGMKYLSGAAEDHTGYPFDGINNYVRQESAITFTKDQLEKMLQESGYGKLEFYYPMPDYKLPYVIYSDDYLPGVGEVRNMSKAYSGINYQMFSENMAYDIVCNDNRFPYFANSFLLIAENIEEK